MIPEEEKKQLKSLFSHFFVVLQKVYKGLKGLLIVCGDLNDLHILNRSEEKIWLSEVVIWVYPPCLTAY